MFLRELIFILNWCSQEKKAPLSLFLIVLFVVFFKRGCNMVPAITKAVLLPDGVRDMLVWSDTANQGSASENRASPETTVGSRPEVELECLWDRCSGIAHAALYSGSWDVSRCPLRSGRDLWTPEPLCRALAAWRIASEVCSRWEMERRLVLAAAVPTGTLECPYLGRKRTGLSNHLGDNRT